MVKFNNRSNEPIETKDGNIFWHSRSVAVVVTIIAHHAGTDNVLLLKRGQGTPDYQGFYCLPCGYLDWDETIYEAALREVWEETGLDLEGNDFKLVGFGEQSPWKIVSEPQEDARQNVCMHFGFYKNIKKSDLPVLTNKNCEEDEVVVVRWENAYKATKRTLAFNHHETIVEFTNELYSK